MENQSLKKKLLYAILFIAYPAYILQAAVVSPVFTITNGNILYKGGLLSVSFYFLGIVIDLFVIFLSLAIVIYGLYRLTIKDMRSIITVTLLAPLFKNLLKLAISPLVDGVLNFDQLVMDSYSLLVSSVFEALQILFILIIAYSSIKRKNKQAQLLQFEKILSMKNPLQVGAFVSGVIVSLIRIVMHLIDDSFGRVSLSLNMIFLLPYVLSLACGALGYFFMLYVFISIGAHDE